MPWTTATRMSATARTSTATAESSIVCRITLKMSTDHPSTAFVARIPFRFVCRCDAISANAAPNAARAPVPRSSSAGTRAARRTRRPYPGRAAARRSRRHQPRRARSGRCAAAVATLAHVSTKAGTCASPSRPARRTTVPRTPGTTSIRHSTPGSRKSQATLRTCEAAPRTSRISGPLRSRVGGSESSGGHHAGSLSQQFVSVLTADREPAPMLRRHGSAASRLVSSEIPHPALRSTSQDAVDAFLRKVPKARGASS